MNGTFPKVYSYLWNNCYNELGGLLTKQETIKISDKIIEIYQEEYLPDSWPLSIYHFAEVEGNEEIIEFVVEFLSRKSLLFNHDTTGLSYADKLKLPAWQCKRLSVLIEHGFECEICHSSSKTLHVHHSNYHEDKDRDPWDYPNCLLMCLCEDCHAKEHAK